MERLEGQTNKRGEALYSIPCGVCGKLRINTKSNLSQCRQCRSCASSKLPGMNTKGAYRSWQEMKSRCLNTSNKRFKHYGAKGVSIYPDWIDSFENFFADLGPRPVGMSLDRINPDGNYEPGNCRWASELQQAQNQRVRSGITLLKDGRFLVRRQIGYQALSLGRFEDKQMAKEIYQWFVGAIQKQLQVSVEQTYNDLYAWAKEFRNANLHEKMSELRTIRGSCSV